MQIDCPQMNAGSSVNSAKDGYKSSMASPSPSPSPQSREKLMASPSPSPSHSTKLMASPFQVQVRDLDLDLYLDLDLDPPLSTIQFIGYYSYNRTLGFNVKMLGLSLPHPHKPLCKLGFLSPSKIAHKRRKATVCFSF